METNRSDIIAQAEQELLAIHAGDRQAHFATDARSLIARQAEPYIYVRDGTINYTARAESLQHFEEYFQNATYYEWDNLFTPLLL